MCGIQTPSEAGPHIGPKPTTYYSPLSFNFKLATNGGTRAWSTAKPRTIYMDSTNLTAKITGTMNMPPFF